MIYIIGIGPGDKDGLTIEALDALKECEIISGYEKYIELVKKFLPEKFFLAYPMRSEIDRCRHALKISQKDGKKIALISSGDAGVYGMAGLMLEAAKGTGEDIKIISGVTAANSAASILGAPLMNDYVTISLSNLLTSWELIEKRLIAACEGDFVICLYNPASRHRPENFKRACEILLRYKSPDTPCGYVRNIKREGQEAEIMTLEKIKDCGKIDMLCTVIIGNSQTYILDGKLITSRGYKENIV
ncbi:MAG: precorrin-3B C(17)-methyltransferase [Synergistales bacterium]|nr:precorrin-3B C(17)-methyltransferase [Synergistales bacterium]MDY6401184.1 precorrin-3B C(17)-methyltransferase [Synergistales bacterium]MDY6404777.1 precorrin-3B C(17)-methyltransferase [Synergistales bacterium]MDY6409983.1 precorrin-3B C(17)-methyltransferase [Synergistales bacterium]MDY6414535.1 precorrin-3B C(17)-methyltransferase [Synergistales bacterium]